MILKLRGTPRARSSWARVQASKITESCGGVGSSTHCAAIIAATSARDGGALLFFAGGGVPSKSTARLVRSTAGVSAAGTTFGSVGGSTGFAGVNGAAC